jgi:hypothetical protein
MAVLRPWQRKAAPAAAPVTAEVVRRKIQDQALGSRLVARCPARQPMVCPTYRARPRGWWAAAGILQTMIQAMMAEAMTPMMSRVLKLMRIAGAAGEDAEAVWGVIRSFGT